MKQTSGTFVVVALLLTAFFVAGCGGGGKATVKPRPWNISITKKTPATIEVDLIGVTELEKAAWEGYPIDEYWKPGDLRRANADKLSLTNLVMNKAWDIREADPQWKKWLSRGVTSVLIIAHLPGTFPPGPADPRRVFVSLDKRAWKDKTIRFDVLDTEIRPLTPQR